MRLLHSKNFWRILKLSRISQRQSVCLGPVILTGSARGSKCKHTGTCLSLGVRQNNHLLRLGKWEKTSHLALKLSNSVLKYSTEEKDYLSKEAIVPENLKDKDDFKNNEIKFSGVVEQQEESSRRYHAEEEQQKARLTLDDKQIDNNDDSEDSVVSSPGLFKIGDAGSREEITNKDFSSSISDERQKEDVLSEEEEEEEDDIEDFIDYGYILDDEDDTDIQLYTPPIELKRGTTGVFDIEELLIVLEDENGIDVCVIDVPQSKNYVDNMIIVSGKSARHIRSMAENVKWLYKQKKHKSDPFIKIEGLNTNNWMAMDLGNIALHIFLPQLREKYDLETLWTIGDVEDGTNLELDDPYAMRSMPVQNEEVLQVEEASNLTPERKMDNSSQIQNLSTKH